ncbi:hypothetical protein F4818DRAFT_451822 [Hypoxylon cercidicola]|nr:hypothetical protein F4818DRAFT_451822 [Hypoxylon cercidicola]
MADLLEEFENKLRDVVDSMDVIRFDLQQPGEGDQYLSEEFRGTVQMLQATTNDVRDAYRSISSSLERVQEAENSLGRDREAHSSAVTAWQKEADQREARLAEREKALQDQQRDLVFQKYQISRDRAAAEAERVSSVTNAIRGQTVRELRRELETATVSNDERKELAERLHDANNLVRQGLEREGKLQVEHGKLQQELKDVLERHDDLQRDHSTALENLAAAQAKLDLARVHRMEAIHETREECSIETHEAAAEGSRQIAIVDGKLDALGKVLYDEQIARRDAESEIKQLSTNAGRLTEENRQLRLAFHQEQAQRKEHEDTIQRLEVEMEEMKTPLTQFAASRRTGEDAIWQRILNEVDVFLFDFRPNVELGSTLTLADVIPHFLPLCWSRETKTNLSDFLEEADPAEWYCFQQVADTSVRVRDDESLVPEGELCPLHGSGRCVQARSGKTDNGRPSIVLRSVVNGVESVLTAEQLQMQEEEEDEELS